MYEPLSLPSLLLSSFILIQKQKGKEKRERRKTERKEEAKEIVANHENSIQQSAAEDQPGALPETPREDRFPIHLK